MRNLAARIKRLEEVYSPAEIIVIMLTHFGEGEIKGWGAEGFYVARNPGESEEALASRAAAEARSYYKQHPALMSGHVVLQMDREGAPHAKPEPAREPIPETRAAPKAQPSKTEITVIRDWTI